MLANSQILSASKNLVIQQSLPVLWMPLQKLNFAELSPVLRRASKRWLSHVMRTLSLRMCCTFMNECVNGVSQKRVQYKASLFVLRTQLSLWVSPVAAIKREGTKCNLSASSLKGRKTLTQITYSVVFSYSNRQWIKILLFTNTTMDNSKVKQRVYFGIAKGCWWDYVFSSRTWADGGKGKQRL